MNSVWGSKTTQSINNKYHNVLKLTNLHSQCHEQSINNKHHNVLKLTNLYPQWQHISPLTHSQWHNAQLLLQWRAPNGVLPCRWYVAREHDCWPSSKLTGYRCLPTVHQHQSPLARWYAGALDISSSLLVVAATHWQLGDDLAWNPNVPRGQRSAAFLF